MITAYDGRENNKQFVMIDGQSTCSIRLYVSNRLTTP